MTGYGSHANSNGLPSFSLFKLLFVGIPYFQTHGSHCISMIGTVFVQCFSPGLKKTTPAVPCNGNAIEQKKTSRNQDMGMSENGVYPQL